MTEKNAEKALLRTVSEERSQVAEVVDLQGSEKLVRRLRWLSLDEAKIVLTNGFRPEQIRDFRVENQYNDQLMAYRQPFTMKDGYILKPEMAMKVPQGGFWTNYGVAEELDAVLRTDRLTEEQLAKYFSNPFRPRHFPDMDEFMFGKVWDDVAMSCFFGRYWDWGSLYFESAHGDDVRDVALLISCERDGPWMKSEVYQRLWGARQYWQSELNEETQMVHLLVVVSLGWRAPKEDERCRDYGCKMACVQFVRQIEELEAKGEDPTLVKPAMTLLERAEMWTRLLSGGQ